MSYPDEYLPVLCLGLDDFNRRAFSFLEQENFPQFIGLVLGGRTMDNGKLHRVVINPILSSASLMKSVKLTRYGDVDSVIGVTTQLPFTCPISIYPVPLFNRTLQKNVHVQYEYIDRMVSSYPLGLYA